MTIPVDIDLRPALAALPRRPTAQAQPFRPGTLSVTMHYSGVAYRDRSRSAELAHIVSEAREHLRRDWRPKDKAGNPIGPHPIYGSLYQYEWAVLSDGAIVLLNDPRQFWHSGNKTANRVSCPVHVLLGRGQDLTAPQNVVLGRLFDTLAAHYALPRTAVFGHCEWPRGDGPPQPSIQYRVQPGQSECPGATLHPHLVAYRASVLTATHRTRTIAWARTLPARRGAHTILDRHTLVRVTGPAVEGEAVNGSNLWLPTDRGYILSASLEALL